jgi:hypothetical protein
MSSEQSQRSIFRGQRWAPNWPGNPRSSKIRRQAAEAIYSLIGAAKLNGIDPEAYLRYVLDHPINLIDELLPWNRAAGLTRVPLAARLADQVGRDQALIYKGALWAIQRRTGTPTSIARTLLFNSGSRWRCWLNTRSAATKLFLMWVVATAK